MIAALALTGALFAAASAASPPRADYGPPSLTRLSEADVRLMFSKNLIIRHGPPGHVDYVSDEFSSAGRYFQSGRRIPLTGSYAIRGDLVCVDEGLNKVAEKCRAFYQAPGGELWETLLLGGTNTVVALVRIQIERTPETLKGM